MEGDQASRPDKVRVIREIGTDALIAVITIDEQEINWAPVQYLDEPLTGCGLAGRALEKREADLGRSEGGDDSAVEGLDIDPYKGPDRGRDSTEEQAVVAVVGPDFTN